MRRVHDELTCPVVTLSWNLLFSAKVVEPKIAAFSVMSNSANTNRALLAKRSSVIYKPA